MKRSELSEFAVEEEGFKLKIRRGGNGFPIVTSSQSSSLPYVPALEASPVNSQLTAPSSVPTAFGKDEADITFIKSPMVGTFYRAPSPESKPFTDTGAKVTATSVVCIIEAMKIMNEIQAEVNGTIIEVLIESGQPVEYGQRLFKVKQG